MVDCRELYEALVAQGIDFFAGVPDSLLKDICACFTACSSRDRHVITANEGSAVALVAGHYLATSRLGLVYMQNSGLGNAVNPLTSLADPEVYGIPMLLLIGWRGEPGAKKDEPQHVKMGKVTLALLDALGIPTTVLPGESAAALEAVGAAAASARARAVPHALVVRAGTFASYPALRREAALPLSRERAIDLFLDAAEPGALFVATTGMPSRELYEQRERRGQPHDSDFLTVGSMGHASQIALAVALRKPARAVYCLDGDGAVLMHMGGLATIGTEAPANLRHVVLNNAAHDSVGGQPTVAFDVDLCAVARACRYRTVLRAETEEEAARALAELRTAPGPALLEIRVRTGARADLGRPKMSPRDLKAAFMAAAGAAPRR